MSREERYISLRTKILWILFMVISLFVALDYEILRLVIYPSFEAFEKREAGKDLDRCVSVLQKEQRHLDSICHDWTMSEGMYGYISDGSSICAESKFTPSSLERNDLDLILLYGEDGKLYRGAVGDRTKDLIDLEDFAEVPQLHSEPVEEDSCIEGDVPNILNTSYGPLVISMHPVHKVDGVEFGRSALILGRFLNHEVVGYLSDQIHVDFDIFPVTHDVPVGHYEAVAAVLSGSERFTIANADNDQPSAYRILDDISGEPAFLLRADLSGEILTRGQNVITFAQVSVLAAGLLVLLVLLILIQRTVISPITKLTGHIADMGKDSDLSNAVTVYRDDEIGTLASEFDDMVSQLEDAREKLVEKSYSAGKGEMISLVLHNLRNILNPIIGEIDIMRERLGTIPLGQMKLAKQELSDGSASTGREKDLREFLNLGIDSLSGLAEEMSEKLDDLITRSNEIVGILNDYSSSGSFEKPAERVELKEILSESVGLIPKDLQQLVTVAMDAELDKVRPIHVHRITCREVLTELLINAAEAIRRAEVEEGRIDIHASEEKIHGESVIHVCICDNGVGIEDDKLGMIFTRGYSSKGSDSRGNGLHWCANTLSAMKGSLQAESQGAGCGTCMHVLLPHENGTSVNEEED